MLRGINRLIGEKVQLFDEPILVSHGAINNHEATKLAA